MKNQIVEVFDLNLEETEMIVPLSKAEAKEHLPVSLRSPFNILAEYRKRDGIDDELAEEQRKQQRQNKLRQIQEEEKRQQEEKNRRERLRELHDRTKKRTRKKVALLNMCQQVKKMIT
jgi:FtsZ-interacting cell division protein YlmF